MQATSDTEQYGCPVARTADLISNKWTPLIIRDLRKGSMRFSELERSLKGISPKTLSERLKRLEESEIVERHCYAEVPPRVEYHLTGKGRSPDADHHQHAGVRPGLAQRRRQLRLTLPGGPEFLLS